MYGTFRIRPAFFGGVLILYGLVSLGSAHAREADSSESESLELKKRDVHLSLYALGGVSTDASTLKVAGEDIPETSLGRGLGAGFKAGIFPHGLKRIIGLEGESFAFGTNVTAPGTVTGGGIPAKAEANFIAVATMANVLVRVPGRTFQPYAGVGGGVSSGYLLASDIEHGADRVMGNAASMTFACQFFGGLRGYVSHTVFVFGEYKYFVATYDWGGNATRAAVTLNLHAHLLSAGVGLSF